MPQRMVELGRIVPNRIYQTITTAGDKVEGPIDVPATETNVLEMLTQGWRTLSIEGYNNDGTNTSNWKFYGTRKFNESVPASGDSFWDVTGVHWETASADQSTIATSTAITSVNLVDKGYTYVVITVAGSGADTSTIARVVLTA